MTEQIINNRQSLEAYKQYLDAEFEKHKYLRTSLKTGKQRTLTQNASLHLFCTQLSDALNDAGYDFREFVKEGYAVPWNEMLVKDYIWRPVQKAITGKESTTKPERHEYSIIYEAVNRKMAEYGLFVPWPNRDDI